MQLEQDLLVARERAELSLHVLLGAVAHLAEFLHARHDVFDAVAGLLLSARDSGVYLAKSLGAGGDTCVDLAAVAGESGGGSVIGHVLGASGKDTSLNHAQQASSLELNVGGVLLLENLLSGVDLGLGHNLLAGEQLDVLGARESVVRVRAGAEVGKSSAGGLLLPLSRVAVAVEDGGLVRPEGLGNSVAGGQSAFNLLGEDVEALRKGGVQERKREADGLAGADGTELEAVAAEGERSRAVAVLQARGDRGDGGGAEVDGGLLGAVARERSTLEDGVDVTLHDVASVEADDGRGCLLCSEAVVVAAGGDADAHDVAVHVDSAREGSDEGDELSLGLFGLARGEEVLAAVGVDTPVAVLAGAVDTGERLLVEQSLDTVMHAEVFNDLEREGVLVGGDVGELEDRAELDLRGGDFVVEGGHADADGPELLLHGIEEGACGRGHFVEVVVVGLLAAGGGSTDERAAGGNEVGAALIERAVHDEELLLPADVGDNAGDVRTLAVDLAGHGVQEAHSRARDGVLRAEQHGLLVQRVAGVGNEARRDVEGGVADERRGGRVPVHEGRGAVRDAKSTVGEGGTVSLVVEELGGGEALDALADGAALLAFPLVVVVEEAVVLQSAGPAHGREPMSVLAAAPLLGPLAQGVRQLVASLLGHGLAGRAGVQERLERVVVQCALHGAVVEAVLGEVLAKGGLLHGGRLGVDLGSHL